MVSKHTLYFEIEDVTEIIRNSNFHVSTGSLVISDPVDRLLQDGSHIRIDGVDLVTLQIGFQVKKYVKCVNEILFLHTYGEITSENLPMPVIPPNTDIDIITLGRGFSFKTGRVVSATNRSIKLELEVRSIIYSERYYEISLENGKQLLSDVYHIKDTEDLTNVSILTNETVLLAPRRGICPIRSDEIFTLLKFPKRDHIITCSVIFVGNTVVARISTPSLCINTPVYIVCEYYGSCQLISDRQDIAIDKDRSQYLLQKGYMMKNKILIRSDHFHGQLDFVLAP